MNDSTTKTCTKCNVEYPSNPIYWSRAKHGKHGLSAACKQCRNGWDKKQWKSYLSKKLLEHQGFKKCSKCEKVYPHTSEFWRYAKFSKDGLRSNCRGCDSEYSREYHYNNRDKCLQAMRKRYANNPEYHRERVRKYNVSNKINRSKYNRMYRKKNLEKLRKRNRQWFLDNPHRAREIRSRRRARLLKSQGSHTAAELRQQYSRQKGRCYYCNVELGSEYHIEHVIPLSRGGGNDIDNIVFSCVPCNLSKGDKLPHEWDGTNRLL